MSRCCGCLPQCGHIDYESNMIRLLLLILLASQSASVAAADSLWYCNELDSAGLRYHYGKWTRQSFKLANHPVQQRDYQLELESFGMLADTTDCSFDYKASIISCTDRYTLFNLNIKTGRAAMSHVLGWVNQSPGEFNVPNDLSVTAIQCRTLIPAPVKD